MADTGPIPSVAYRGRFAPSPTGSLHLGNARTALVAWARARASGGAFILRVEDLDGPRTRREALAGNLAELRWLGLDWDEGPDVGGPYAPYRQSERSHLYRAALDRLERAGMVFDCYLSRKDVAEASSAPHAADREAGQQAALGSVYGPAQRSLNTHVSAARAAQGRTPSVRLRSDRVAPHDEAKGGATVEFSDAIAGPQAFEVERDVGDIVLLRSDGLWAYQLAVVVDDAAMGVTEVVRGADLLASTAAQLLVYGALGVEPPGFAHVGLLMAGDGQRLSKRTGPLSLGDLMSAGVDPRRVVGLLAHTLGWLDSPARIDANELLGMLPADVGAPAEPARLTERELAFLTTAD